MTHSQLSHAPEFNSNLAELRLLHIADSALPIGSLAHSFGIETLVLREFLSVKTLPNFFEIYLAEAGLLEAVFCRAAFRLVSPAHESFPAQQWVELNDRLSARKSPRESRAGSAALGRNFLKAILKLGNSPPLPVAWEASRQCARPIHHSPAFGLASAALGLWEDRAILAYLHQNIASLVSACQRLMPLGQTEAMQILWNLKPAMTQCAERSSICGIENVVSFTPMLDWGAMEHPALATRLFVS
ncbi:MAG: urease accessory protein UreF [Candidatus Acidiferrales bacterium]